MDVDNVEALLSYHCLIAPLDPNPVSDIDKIVNELRIKYRTYVVEFNVEYGVVVLPTMFGYDFGDQLGHYARLMDPNHNEFDVMVEHAHGLIYVTKGWNALLDFYGISQGAWVTMVFVGNGKSICCPAFNPPVKFKIEQLEIPFHAVDNMPAPFRHDELNFENSYEKTISFRH